MNSKLCKINNKIIVLLGDGELNEGTIWESIQIASAYKLDNLIIIIDRNGIQANKMTEELSPLENLAAKFIAFNCAVKEFDGHDFESISSAFSTIPLETYKPTVLIAKTIRGKGIKSIENRVDKWFVTTSVEERNSYLTEIINN